MGHYCDPEAEVLNQHLFKKCDGEVRRDWWDVLCVEGHTQNQEELGGVSS